MFYALTEKKHACIFTFSPGWCKLSLKLYQKTFPVLSFAAWPLLGSSEPRPVILECLPLKHALLQLSSDYAMAALEEKRFIKIASCILKGGRKKSGSSTSLAWGWEKNFVLAICVLRLQ